MDGNTWKHNPNFQEKRITDGVALWSRMNRQDGLQTFANLNKKARTTLHDTKKNNKSEVIQNSRNESWSKTEVNSKSCKLRRRLQFFCILTYLDHATFFHSLTRQVGTWASLGGSEAAAEFLKFETAGWNGLAHQYDWYLHGSWRARCGHLDWRDWC